MELIKVLFQAIGFLASILGIISFFKDWTTLRIEKYVNLAFTILTIILLIISFTYFNLIDAERHAGEYYDRYYNISFEDDLPGTKIKSAVSDGIVIMKDLKFDKKYPELYNSILGQYIDANNDESFQKEKYVSICREIFGALGSYSKKLYKD